MKSLWIALVAFGCSPRETTPSSPEAKAAPLPIPAATATAAGPSPTASPVASVEERPPDAAAIRLMPTSATDLDWIEETLRLLRRRPPVAEIKEHFGSPDGKNGSFDKLRPWSPLWQHVLFLERPAPPLRSVMVQVTLLEEGRPQLSRIEARFGKASAPPRVHFDSPETRVINLHDRVGLNASRIIMELAKKPEAHLVRELTVDNAEVTADFWSASPP